MLLVFGDWRFLARHCLQNALEYERFVEKKMYNRTKFCHAFAKINLLHSIYNVGKGFLAYYRLIT